MGSNLGFPQNTISDHLISQIINIPVYQTGGMVSYLSVFWCVKLWCSKFEIYQALISGYYHSCNLYPFYSVALVIVRFILDWTKGCIINSHFCNIFHKKCPLHSFFTNPAFYHKACMNVNVIEVCMSVFSFPVITHTSRLD